MGRAVGIGLWGWGMGGSQAKGPRTNPRTSSTVASALYSGKGCGGMAATGGTQGTCGSSMCPGRHRFMSQTA